MPLILLMLLFWLPLLLYRRAVSQVNRQLEAADPTPLERYTGDRSGAIQADDWSVR